MGCTPSKGSDGGSAVGDVDSDEFFSKVDLFKRLPPDDLPILRKACNPAEFEPGKPIIKQGDMGDEFFIIKSGKARVEVDGTMVAHLNAGDYFGEQALLRDDPRNATIVATTKIVTLKISREEFGRLGLKEHLELGKRGAVGGAGKDVTFKAPTQKTPDDKTLITEALKNNSNLTSIISLDDAKIQAMVDIMWKDDVAKEKQIIKEGDLSADYFYVVSSGSFAVSAANGAQSADNAQNRAGANAGPAVSADGNGESMAITLGAGSSFGELALLYLAPRAATITAVVDSTVFVIARPQFKDILQSSAREAAKGYVKYLSKAPILANLVEAEFALLAEAVREVSFADGNVIFSQGDAGDCFYILIEGEVSISQGDKGVEKSKTEAKKKPGVKSASKESKDAKAPPTSLKASKDNYPCFGEQALLKNDAREMTVTVTKSAKCFKLEKVSFNMLVGPLADIQKRGKDSKKGKTVVKKAEIDMSRFGKIQRSELNRVGLLGCGGFGVVEMVEHVKSGETYALKGLNKGYILKTGMEKSVMHERDCQMMCDSIFIIKLYETFNGEQSLYLLLELAVGGELFATYNKKGLFGNEKCAQFYIAGAMMAFDHMHAFKMAFRDLKPENLLLNEKGQTKLTDMGLAKIVHGKTYTTCGTPDYFAPEIITSAGHDQSVDWWTLGILNYELLAGYPPFESATPFQIYQKITKGGIEKAQMPKACQGKPESLIKGNCHQKPDQRLPMQPGGSDNIKKHPWYQGFDFDAFAGMTLDPPYMPVTSSKKDLANFSVNKDDMPPQMKYKDPGNGWDKTFATST